MKLFLCRCLCSVPLLFFPLAPAPRSPPGCRAVEAIFSPGGGPGTLRAVILREVRACRTSLDVALYTGMTADIAREVAAASRGRRVRVLVDPTALASDPSQGENGPPRWREILAEARVPIRAPRLVHLPEDQRPAFHHKFAVIDRAAVLTGSYNWSVRGDGLNYENLVVIRDRTLAGRFAGEFERLWRQAERCPPPRSIGSAKEGADGRPIKR